MRLLLTSVEQGLIFLYWPWGILTYKSLIHQTYPSRGLFPSAPSCCKIYNVRDEPNFKYFISFLYWKSCRASDNNLIYQIKDKTYLGWYTYYDHLVFGKLKD